MILVSSEDESESKSMSMASLLLLLLVLVEEEFGDVMGYEFGLVYINKCS